MSDLRERWREAAAEAVGDCYLLTENNRSVARHTADAAVRVVLEALLDRASYGLNLDDGIWCRRLQVLLDDGQLAGFSEDD